jgi:hypothetical protein
MPAETGRTLTRKDSEGAGPEEENGFMPRGPGSAGRYVRPFDARRGKRVKKQFPCDHLVVRGEHVWAEVLRVEGGRRIGRLDNSPRWCADLRCDDIVSLGEGETVAGEVP